MREMYENPYMIKKAFDPKFLSKDLLQAQESEMAELKKIIKELSSKKGGPISILDIGIGDSRVPKHLSKTDGVWKK